MPEGGVFLVDKPLGWTSFDVVNKIRFALGRRLNEKRPKVGHAGTLDPLATGLLLICVGKHTKQIDLLQAERKIYSGHFIFGAVTASYDRETPIENQVPTDHLTQEMIEQARNQFIGPLAQYPPMFSAVKMDGKKLYEVARAGKTLELEARKVEIFQYEVGRLEKVSENQTQDILLKPTVKYFPEVHGIRVPFEVTCSKGTYIRSLAFDMGQTLGCGGYLGSLRRTASGNFTVHQAYTVDQWVNGLNQA